MKTNDMIPEQEQLDKGLTEQEIDCIRRIRSRGFAVIVWTPEELGAADQGHVEDRSIELGWEVIRDLQD